MPRWRPLLPLTGLACLAGLACGADDYEFGRTGFGAWLTPVPLDQQAAQDLEPGQGMLVVGVRPGGTASSLGLQPGDVLLALDGAPIASRQDLRSVIHSVQPGDPAQAVVVQADGSLVQADGTFIARRPRPPWWNPPPQEDPSAAQQGASAPAAPPPRAPWMQQDPHDTIAGQRADLLAEADALASAQTLVDDLLARLGLADDGRAWRLDLTITAPSLAAPSLAAPGAAAADGDDADARRPGAAPAPTADGAPGWSLRLDIASSAP